MGRGLRERGKARRATAATRTFRLGEREGGAAVLTGGESWARKSFRHGGDPQCSGVGRGLREDGLEVPVKAGPRENFARSGDADGARTFRVR